MKKIEITRTYDHTLRRWTLRVTGALHPDLVRSVNGVTDVQYRNGYTLVYPARGHDSLSVEQELARRLGVSS